MASHSHSQTDEGRSAILRELLEGNCAQLLRQAQAHSGSSHDAEDALADACIQFLRFYDGPSGVDALRWMQVVVKRCAWKISRRRSQLTDVVLGGWEDVATTTRAEASGPEELLERREDTLRLARLISTLKPAEREALLLVGLGYSYREIADMKGWTTTKVNRCLAEGRAAVRRFLKEGERK
jgi:RNA polymerase sigma factor (sigma-70 family)